MSLFKLNYHMYVGKRKTPSCRSRTFYGMMRHFFADIQTLLESGRLRIDYHAPDGSVRTIMRIDLDGEV